MKTLLVLSIVFTVVEVHGEGCPYTRDKPCTLSLYRTPDGSCNNLENPQWGVANFSYGRLTPNSYSDGIHALPSGLMNARNVSLMVFPDVTQKDDELNVIALQWGQVVAHDMSFTAGVPQTGVDNVICCTNGEPIPPVTADSDPRCAPIALLKNDPYNAPEGNTCINFYRTLSSKDFNCSLPGKVQDPVSGVTAYLDISIAYGNSPYQSEEVRLFSGGELASVMRNGEQWLPQDTNVTFACNNVQSAQEPCYFAGDVRVNQNPQLALLQNILMREHNRIAAKLRKINPHWDDEKTFQEAKRINIAEAQHITYNGFLRTFLGKYAEEKGLSYPGAKSFIDDYNSKVDPRVVVEHATGAYRDFHTQIVGYLKKYYENRQQEGEIRLSDWFGRPLVIEQGNNTSTLTRGLTTQPQNAIDRFFTSEITQYFFRPLDQLLGDDMRAIDIQRSRDHGVGLYVDVLKYCNLSYPSSFDDLKKYIKPDYVKLLKRVYTRVEDVELIVAGLLETPINGTRVGPTFLCILLDQFYRTRVGDRFFFENGKQSGSFTLEQLNSIRNSSIARMLCDNVRGIETMQPDAFYAISPKNPLVPCKSLPKINLNLWKENISNSLNKSKYL